MNPIHIEFGKLEIGTLFYDTATKDYYRKISETHADPESERYDRRVEWGVSTSDAFNEFETVIVK